MQKTKFGIDTRMICRSGIGVYIRNLLQHTISRNLLKPEDLLLFGEKHATEHFCGATFPVVPLHSKIYSIREQIELLAKANRVELWHAPHYNIPLGFQGKLIVTVHDLTHYIFRNQFYSLRARVYTTLMFRQVFRRASAIIAVSENTKNDITKHFAYPDEKIHVIGEGVSKEFRILQDKAQLDAMRRYFRLPQKFILYVGLVKPHKNIEALIRAVCDLRKRGIIREKLAIIGKRDPAVWKKLSSEFGGELNENVIHINFVREEDLPIIYNLARLFVLPSFYEGFGLTILEAFACGTPVLASNIASIPEVAGDAAMLFDPHSTDELKQKLVKLLTDSELRDSLRKKGLGQVKKFSWETMAHKTIALYKKVLGE